MNSRQYLTEFKRVIKESLIKLLLPLLKVFGNKNFAALHEVTGMEGHFFRRKTMHLKQIDIVINGNEIALHQENNGCDNFISLTPEMISLVTAELNKLKNELDKNGEKK